MRLKRPRRVLVIRNGPPPSPVRESRQIDSDADDEVLVLDSDAEKSDWSEIEHETLEGLDSRVLSWPDTSTISSINMCHAPVA